MQQGFGIGVVILHHVFAIPLGGGRAGTFMEHRLDRVEQFARFDPEQKFIFVQVVGNLAVLQIPKLVPIA